MMEKLRSLSISVSDSQLAAKAPAKVKMWLLAANEEQQVELTAMALDVFRAYKCLERYQAWVGVKLALTRYKEDGSDNPDFDIECYRFFREDPTCVDIRSGSQRVTDYSVALSYMTCFLRKGVKLLGNDGKVTKEFKNARAVVRNENARGAHLEILMRYLTPGVFLVLASGWLSV